MVSSPSLLPEIDRAESLAGEVVHVNAIGQHIIHLNKYEVAFDLLERRSAKYSDRPLTEMIKLSVFDTIIFIPQGYR